MYLATIYGGKAMNNNTTLKNNLITNKFIIITISVIIICNVRVVLGSSMNFRFLIKTKTSTLHLDSNKLDKHYFLNIGLYLSLGYIM